MKLSLQLKLGQQLTMTPTATASDKALAAIDARLATGDSSGPGVESNAGDDRRV